MDGDEAYRSGVEARFEAVLRQVEAAKRELTAWEAQCLLLAAKSIATGDWLLADQHVGWSKDRPPARHRAPPILATVEGLRSAVEMSRRLREMRATPAEKAR